MTAYDIGDDEWRNKAFRRMNVKISSNLKESNLEDLRYLFEADGVPLSDLEEANTGIKIFKLLEQRGLYGPHNVKILKDALESLGREDLRKHIIEFESVKVFDEETDGASRRQPGKSVGLPVQQQQPQARQYLCTYFLLDNVCILVDFGSVWITCDAFAFYSDDRQLSERARQRHWFELENAGSRA
jgi:hypothetical protein